MLGFKETLWYSIWFWSLCKALCSPKRPLEVKPPENFLKKSKVAEFGQDLIDLHTSNRLPAQKVAGLLQKATGLGLSFDHPFKNRVIGHQAPAEPEEGNRNKNALRTFRRWMRKDNQWGDLYWAKIPLWDKKKKTIFLGSIPFLLPHEVLSQYMALPGAKDEAIPARGTWLENKLRRVCLAWEEPAQGMVPLAIHGDGVPVQGRMNQSTVDFLTFNFPGSLGKAHKRIPICCLDAQWNAGDQTINAIWEVIKWSLESLGQGKHPTARHDGSEFLPHQDDSRKNRAGQSLSKAALVYIRADWDFFCKWLAVPQFNVKTGMCWMCACTPEEWRASSKEQRHKQSLSKADFISKHLVGRKKTIPPIFHLPGIDNNSLQPDWMHCVDEGFGSCVAGNILYSLLPGYGANKEQQIKGLWEHILDLYGRLKIPSDKRLSKLTYKDIKRDQKAPELQVKASAMRHFAVLLEPLCREKSLHEGNLEQKAIYKVAKYATKMYHHLEVFNPAELAQQGEKLVSQYMALEKYHTKLDSDSNLWHAKPKVHLLGHILDKVAGEGMNPKDTWNYKDETFGSKIQSYFFRRGGSPNAGSDAEKVLLSFMSNEPWLGILEPEAGT